MATSSVKNDSTNVMVTAPQAMNVTELRANAVINSFMPFVLLIAGCICNVFIILGMRTRSFRNLSSSIYMITMAVNDFISLTILLVPHWLHLNFPETIHRHDHFGDGLCKFFNFYGWGQADLSIMLMTAMTMDRAHVILKPMTSINVTMRAKIVIVVCVCVVAVKESHFLFTSRMVEAERKDRLCDVAVVHEVFYSRVWPWIGMVFVTLCFLFIIASNSVIIAYVRRQRRGRVMSTGGEATARWYDKGGEDPGASGQLRRTSSTMTVHSLNYENVANQVTRMLLSESMIFILLSYPFSFHLVISSLTESRDRDHSANHLAFNVVFYLLNANKCVTFLVYCVVGRRFRRAIVDDVLGNRNCCKLPVCTDNWLTWRSDRSVWARVKRLRGGRKAKDDGGGERAMDAGGGGKSRWPGPQTEPGRSLTDVEESQMSEPPTPAELFHARLSDDMRFSSACTMEWEVNIPRERGTDVAQHADEPDTKTAARTQSLATAAEIEHSASSRTTPELAFVNQLADMS